MRVPCTAQVACLVLVASVVACSTDALSDGYRARELARNRTRWQSAAIGSYRFKSTQNCFCGFAGDADVTVRNGQVIRVVQRRDGTEQPTQSRGTIDGLFVFVQLQLEQDPSHLRVTYDPVLGFPRTIFFGTPENDGGGSFGADSVVVIP